MEDITRLQQQRMGRSTSTTYLDIDDVANLVNISSAKSDVSDRSAKIKRSQSGSRSRSRSQSLSRSRSESGSLSRSSRSRSRSLHNDEEGNRSSAGGTSKTTQKSTPEGSRKKGKMKRRNYFYNLGLGFGLRLKQAIASFTTFFLTTNEQICGCGGAGGTAKSIEEKSQSEEADSKATDKSSDEDDSSSAAEDFSRTSSFRSRTSSFNDSALENDRSKEVSNSNSNNNRIKIKSYRHKSQRTSSSSKEIPSWRLDCRKTPKWSSERCEC